MDLLQISANALASLMIPFQIKDQDRETSLILDDGTEIRFRERSLQFSKKVLENPTEKQKSIAFWYETRRLGEATFVMMEKTKEGGEALFLTLRIPVPPKSLRVRFWKPFFREALRQIAVSEKKIHDGSWGDLKPEE